MGMSLKVFRDKPEIVQFDYNLSGLQEVYEELLRAQDEVGGTVIYRAKVAAGGGKSFDIVTGDESQDVSVPTITGVIIHNHKCNARFAEGGAAIEPPVCSSIDGRVGINRDDGEYRRRDGRAVYIECKLAYNRSSDEQSAFVIRARECGALAGVCYSVEDALNLIKEAL